MRRLPTFLLTLVLAPLLAGLLTPAVAAKAPTYAASLTFRTFDTTGCTETFVAINAGTSDDAGTPYLEVDDLTIYDHCQAQLRVMAYFRTQTFAFTVHPRLTSATITGTVPRITCFGEVAACNQVSDGLYIDLTLTGVGELIGQPGGSLTRAVTATGIVSDGATNYAPEASVSGLLARNKG